MSTGDKQLTMSREQAAQYERLGCVIQHLQDHPQIISLNKALESELSTLVRISSSIEEKSVRRGLLKNATTNVKKNARIEMAHITFVFSRSLRALGRQSQITELINLTGFFESRLMLARYSALAERAAVIAELLKKYKAELLEHQAIQEQEILGFEASVEKYGNTISETDAHTAEIVGATADLKTLFKDASKSISTINDIIAGMQKKHPEFYRTYKLLKTVKRYGVRHKKDNPDESAADDDSADSETSAPEIKPEAAEDADKTNPQQG